MDKNENIFQRAVYNKPINICQKKKKNPLACTLVYLSNNTIKIEEVLSKN